MMKDDFTNGCDVKADVPDDQKGRHYDVFEEGVIVAQVFMTSGLLKAIEQRVRLSRARIGTYEVVDFLAVLIGYGVSGATTLETFYERLTPFATPFMALFDRERLPHRSTLTDCQM